jgi:hypothetical protein
LTVHSVRIKGGPNDEAVLCTADKTFTVRLAESSNLKMLGVSARTKRMRPDSEQTDEVWIAEASATAHFELVRSAPRTGTLATILAARQIEAARRGALARPPPPPPTRQTTSRSASG